VEWKARVFPLLELDDSFFDVEELNDSENLLEYEKL